MNALGPWLDRKAMASRTPTLIQVNDTRASIGCAGSGGWTDESVTRTVSSDDQCITGPFFGDAARSACWSR